MISIITPVLNGADFIEKNIISIQKLAIPFEHIIVDGGSTDKTLEILKLYPHLKVIHQEEKSGMYGAIHIGFSEAIYDIITWINSDDYIIPDLYNAYLGFVFKNTNFNFFYSDAFFYYANINKKVHIKANRFCKVFLKRGILPFVQPTAIFHKSLYQQESLNYKCFRICGDLDLFVRFASIDFFSPLYYEKPTVVFLKYGASLGDRNHNLYLIEKKNIKNKNTLFSRLLFRITKFI